MASSVWEHLSIISWFGITHHDLKNLSIEESQILLCLNPVQSRSPQGDRSTR